MNPEVRNLNISYFELGYLTAAIRPDLWDSMPRTLWLKLHIASTQAYLNHETFGSQAHEDVRKWTEELNKLEER